MLLGEDSMSSMILKLSVKLRWGMLDSRPSDLRIFFS